MRYAIGNRQPLRKIDPDRAGVVSGDIVPDLIVDRKINVAVLISGDGLGQLGRCHDIDVFDGAGATENTSENRPFDPVANVGEDQVTIGDAELIGQRVRIAGPGRVNPHVDPVFPHGAGENEIELVVSDQAQPNVHVGPRIRIAGVGNRNQPLRCGRTGRGEKHRGQCDCPPPETTSGTADHRTDPRNGGFASPVSIDFPPGVKISFGH